MDLKVLEEQFRKETPLPKFQVGDVVNVHVKIREGEKERTQIFAGTVIKIRGGGKSVRSTFTVRRIVAGEGVERTFPFHSPLVEHIEVTRPGKVRRAKLYYLRQRVGKATKVKERRVDTPAPTAKQKKKKKKKKKTKKRIEPEAAVQA